MAKNKCRCGSKYFENVDVTPIGSIQKEYFTRCKKCGLVVAAYGCKSYSPMSFSTVFYRILGLTKSLTHSLQKTSHSWF